MATIYCTNCGTPNQPTAHFCTKCGEKLVPKMQEEKPIQNKVNQAQQQQIIPKKKSGCLSIIGKILLGLVILFALGIILLLAFDSVTSSGNNTTQKEIALDENDPHSADKYRNGIGITPDPYKAFELYKKAAEKGDNKALVELADYYQEGIWVKKDKKRAKKLLQQAADAGYLPAQWQLEYLQKK